MIMYSIYVIFRYTRKDQQQKKIIYLKSTKSHNISKIKTLTIFSSNLRNTVKFFFCFMKFKFHILKAQIRLFSNQMKINYKYLLKKVFIVQTYYAEALITVNTV